MDAEEPSTFGAASSTGGGAVEVRSVELAVGEVPDGDAAHGPEPRLGADTKAQVAAASVVSGAMYVTRKGSLAPSDDGAASDGAEAPRPSDVRGSRGDAAPPSERRLLLDACVAELIGTFFIVVFGTGVVTAATVLSAQVGLWQIAAVWGWGVSLAIFTTAEVSGAHLNPAISLALALLRPRDFPARKLMPYVTAQMLGGILGGAVNLACFASAIARYEDSNNVVRSAKHGHQSGEATARVFGEYPDHEIVSPVGAMAIEAWGTAILAFVIFSLTDTRNTTLGPRKQLAPLMIGFTVAVLISVFAPLTQAGWNPARDFGPRVVAALAGWGSAAIPGPKGAFWAYIVGPCIGAPVGGLIYDVLVGAALERKRLAAAATAKAE